MLIRHCLDFIRAGELFTIPFSLTLNTYPDEVIQWEPHAAQDLARPPSAFHFHLKTGLISCEIGVNIKLSTQRKLLHECFNVIIKDNFVK